MIFSFSLSLSLKHREESCQNGFVGSMGFRSREREHHREDYKSERAKWGYLRRVRRLRVKVRKESERLGLFVRCSVLVIALGYDDVSKK